MSAARGSLEGQADSTWRSRDNQKMLEWVSGGVWVLGGMQRSALCFEDAIDKGPLLDAFPIEQHHHLQIQISYK